jgi:hypothetical protein
MKTLISSLVVILLAAAGGPAQAQIYKWVDEAGKTHYSDNAPANRKKVDTVTDRISVYTTDPSIARAAATAGANPALSDRVARLEQQLQNERLARQQQYELAAYTQASQADYGGNTLYAGPVALVPVRHRRPHFVPMPFTGRTAGNVVGPGIMPGTFNGPNAITAGNFTVRTSLPAQGSRGGASFAPRM